MPSAELDENCRIEVDITSVAAGGDGIARLPDGRVVFCAGALPGERVRVEVVEERPDFARAVVVDVVVPSPARTFPPCPWVAGGCGGCAWQHVERSAGPELKAGIVADALRRIAKLGDVPVSPVPATVALEGYRTTVRVAVTPAGRAAYRRRRSHDLIAIDTCLVAHPRADEVLREGRFPGGEEVVIRVGVGSGERLAWVQGRRPEPPAVPAGVAVWLGKGRQPAVHEDVAGRRWRVSARSFFQSGPEAAAALVAAVRRAVAAVEPGPVVDLYAGIGLLGGAIAADWGVPLVAVESQASGAADAVTNLADLDARVERTEVAAWRRDGPAPAAVLADPARTGLGPSAAAAAAAAGAPALVLVSCDPASLGRDTALLERHGYRLEAVDVLDLFPGTPHVEAVARFTASGSRPGGG